MECNCSCDVDEYVEIINDDIRTARKQHECIECGQEIKIGQKYERIVGKYDGGLSTYKTCLTCVSIRHNYCPNGWIYGGLREAIAECLDMDYVTGFIYPF